MILLKTSTRYEARASFDDRHTLKAAGFRWDPAAKSWWCADAAEVERLRGLGVEVEIHEQTEQAAFDIPASWEGHPSCATDGPADIPCPPGLSYLPYQRGGIAYARGTLARQGRAGRQWYCTRTHKGCGYAQMV